MPLKDELLALSFLNNCIPTKNNLTKCRIVNSDNLLGIFGCGGEKTLQHLFIYYLFFSQMWVQYWSGRGWLVLFSMTPLSMLNNFLIYICLTKLLLNVIMLFD